MKKLKIAQKGEYYDTEIFGRYDAMYRAFADYVKGDRKTHLTMNTKENCIS